jgi:hypothetical protein
MKALQVAFNWMLPKPRPNLRSAIDVPAAANLKVAISVAYCVLSKYTGFIKGNEPIFIYNSWRHLCRILRECKYSSTDHMKRCVVYGWVNGCCNLTNPMAVHTGPTYRLTESECWDFGGFEGADTLQSGNLRLRFRTSEEMDCFWIFIYIDGVYSASFRYYKVKLLVHVYNNLKMMMVDSGGLYCVENGNHFYSFNDLLDGLYSGKGCYKVNLPDDVYLGKKSEIILQRRWKAGEVITLENLIDKTRKIELMPSDERIDAALGQLGEYGLIHLLGLKFDHRTAVVLSNYCRAYWGITELAECAISFLIESNDSRSLSRYVKGYNWKRKRFCSDICHMLHYSGYPRLWYYDKKIPTTKVCRPFMLCCKKDEREHFIVEKGKEDYKEYLKKKKRNQKCMMIDPVTNDYVYADMKFMKYMEKPGKVSYNVKKQNSFTTKDRVYNTLVKCNGMKESDKQVKFLEEKLPGLLKESEKIVHKVFDKLDYVNALKSNMEDNIVQVANEVKKVKTMKLIEESLENCRDFKKGLIDYAETKNIPLDAWCRPKKPFKIRATLGREEIFTTTDSVYAIIENFEVDCLERINKIGFSKTDPEKVRVLKQVVSAEILMKQNINHKNKRIEREGNIKRHEEKLKNYKHKFRRWVDDEAVKIHNRAVYNKDRMEKRAKKAITKQNKVNRMSKTDPKRLKIERITELNQQHRSKRVKKIRDVKFMWHGFKTGKFEPMYFIKFPKIEIVGEFDERGQWKWDNTKKLEEKEMPYWKKLDPDQLKLYNKEKTKARRKMRKAIHNPFTTFDILDWVGPGI